MRSLFKLLPLCALFLLTAGCGKSGKTEDGNKDDNGNGGDTGGFEAISIDNYPTLANTSAEPVLLRYKFKKGQTLKIGLDIDMNSEIKQGAQTVNIKMQMGMEATANVTAVDAQGNMSVGMRITRMKMKMGGPQSLEWDSAGGGNPELDVLRALINVNMPCKISPVGKLLESDNAPLMEALDRMGNAALTGQMKDMLDQMVEGTFVQLSEKPVKAGETYEGGTLKMGGAKAKVSYKVRSVSGDKNQAVLEPAAELQFGGGMFPAGAKVTLRKQDFGGWMLFDVEKGYSPKGEGQIRMLMDVTVQGQTVPVYVKGKVTATTTVQ